MSTRPRDFLKLASIACALAIPANDETGSIHDVKHVLMIQENRSFDHYFGVLRVLRGVRGFGDPRVVKLRSGNSVWRQPDLDNPEPGWMGKLPNV